MKEVMAAAVTSAAVTSAVVTTAVQPMEMPVVRATAMATAVCRTLDVAMPADAAAMDLG